MQYQRRLSPFRQLINTLNRTLAPDLGLLLLRWIIGPAMIYHGYMTLFGVTDGVPNIDLFIRGAVEQKLGWPFPELLGYLAKGSEFFGGMLLVLGLLTRVAAFLIGATMAVAAFIIHGDAIIEEGELALVYFVISLVIFIVGPGKYSIDHRLT